MKELSALISKFNSIVGESFPPVEVLIVKQSLQVAFDNDSQICFCIKEAPCVLLAGQGKG
jgi:hypothetical protein